MPATTATAPAKIILFGEHAVVYGRPAIAVPVREVKARVVVKPEPRAEPGTIRIQAPALELEASLQELPSDNPLGLAVRLVLEEVGISRPPSLSLRVTSTIPIAAGMGSGAAVSVAMLRALSAFLGRPLTDEQVCRLAYQVEIIHHGTPSGIDNTTVAYAQPVYFTRGQPILLLHPAQPFTLVIADTGVPSATRSTVEEVRRAWEAEPDRYEALFDRIGSLTNEAYQVLLSGDPYTLGPLMDENQELLAKMGVSSPELEKLVQAARKAGAHGAKLSGGGRGGNMIALADPAQAAHIQHALQQAGAVFTLITEVPQHLLEA